YPGPGKSPGGSAHMIQRLAILGATGDLTARYLLPALAALQAAGELSDDFRPMAVGREEWSDEEYKRWAEIQLERHGSTLPAEAKRTIVSRASYHRVNVTDPASLAAVIPREQALAAYLALPPSVFPATVSALCAAGMVPNSVVVLEKPFSENLTGAIELNQLLTGLDPDHSAFRVDHFLAMTTVQNILGTRLANRVLEPIWNSAHIDA